MKQKEFAKLAIKNGYTGNSCKGWDWIRENISELDEIFQTKQYKDCNRFKSQCMRILLKNENFTELEERVLTTAWYLNNDREYKAEKEKKITEFNKNGFNIIDSDKSLDGRKIEFIVDTSDEMFGRQVKFTGKLKWACVDKRLMAMKPRNRRTGWWVDSANKNVYVKLLKEA